jgi:hypothetical protein
MGFVSGSDFSVAADHLTLVFIIKRRPSMRGLLDGEVYAGEHQAPYAVKQHPGNIAA